MMGASTQAYGLALRSSEAQTKLLSLVELYQLF